MRLWPLLGHGIASPAIQPNTNPNFNIDVGLSFRVGDTFTCTQNGVSVPDTVTPTVVGAPSTGGATAIWNPSPVATGTQTVLTMATKIQTDPAVYTITVSGTGPTCGQYTSSTFTLTVKPIISLNRKALMTVVATGLPTKGGVFAYTVKPVTGTTNVSVGFASGNETTTNPNTAALTDPANPNGTGKPSPGGLASITTNFTDNKLVASNDTSNPYKVPTFGMSCYFTTLQSDWGAAPHCQSITYLGKTYSGTVVNPSGLSGTYCSSFIEEVKIQGSGQLNSGQDIQYISPNIVEVAHINGHDNSPVVANQTVARDVAIIPLHNSYIDLNKIGNGLKANDTGGKILGYRIDLYRGAGKGVCANYDNIMSVGACQTAQTACPASAVQ